MQDYVQRKRAPYPSPEIDLMGTQDAHSATAFHVTGLEDNADTHSVRSSKSHKSTHSVSSTNLHGWNSSPHRSCRSHLGTQILSLAWLQLLSRQQRLPINRLTNLKTAAAFSSRTSLPPALLLLTTTDGFPPLAISEGDSTVLQQFSLHTVPSALATRATHLHSFAPTTRCISGAIALC
jgi:hypothetical protein